MKLNNFYIKNTFLSTLFILCLLTPARSGASKSHSLLTLKKQDLVDALPLNYQLPSLTTPLALKSKDNPDLLVTPQITIEPSLQLFVETLFQQFSPASGAFVAIDAKTGRILSMLGMDKSHHLSNDLAVTAHFPSASIFKIVTAVAAIEQLQFQPNTFFPFQGKFHTLYKNQVEPVSLRHATMVSLKEAFSKSVNAIFGRMGLRVGKLTLEEYAFRLGFNRDFISDIITHQSPSKIIDTHWELVESASGFTQNNKMSALHGALLAASIINDGIFMEPYLIDALLDMHGLPIYIGQPKASHRAFYPDTAKSLQVLMKETLLSGTSRRSFHHFFKNTSTETEAGGKTGSLTSESLQLKTDWFIGYLQHKKQKIAVAVLTGHDGWYHKKSSKMARLIFEYLKKQNP